MVAAAGLSVSVVIPAYNVEATIARAIRSALDQTVPPLEVIVVDDRSGDGTLALVNAIAAGEPRVRRIEAAENRGPSRARNLGFAAARGDWLAILDGDDAWAPDRLERMLAVASAERADMVLDNLVLHDLVAGRDVRLGHRPPWERQRLDEALYWRNCRFGRFQYSILKALVRRDFVERHGLGYPEDMRYGEDLIFYAEVLRAGAAAVVMADGLYIYSTRVGELSGAANPGSRSQPDFAGIVAGIDAFAARHAGRIGTEARAAIAATRRSLATVARANAGRAKRQAGDWAGYAAAMLDPDVLSQLVRLRLRRWQARLSPPPAADRSR
jgi:succinoglycan biosynthesis protein ExoO